MKILFVGDIVGRLGRVTTKKVLPSLEKRDSIGLILANGENLASGRGVTAKTLSEMRSLGIEYFTSGEHIFRAPGFEQEIDDLPILRPENLTRESFTGRKEVFERLPDELPGKGFVLIDKGKNKVLLINLIGSALFVKRESRNPFSVVEEIIEKYRAEGVKNIIVDFHAEATSEKIALAHFLDGRVTAVIGTHTHVPTADGRILPGGTAFITDIGMVGSLDSVIGVKKEIIIDRYLEKSKDPFEWQQSGPAVFNSVLVEFDEKTGKAISIERIDKLVE